MKSLSQCFKSKDVFLESKSLENFSHQLLMHVCRGFGVGDILERVLQRNLPELCTYVPVSKPQSSYCFSASPCNGPTVGLHRASECMNETYDYVQVHSPSLSQA